MGKKNISVIILAGGDSKRINLPKPYLLFNSRTTFLEKLVKEYFKFGCRKIIIVLNKKFFFEDLIIKYSVRYKTSFVINEYPESGKLYSLKLGISYLTNEKFCFIQNIDNPFTNISLLNSLIECKTAEGYSVPIFKEKGGHPILISQSIIEGIKKETVMDFNLRIFLNKYQRNEVIVRYKKITANINTLKDYRKYFYNNIKQLPLNNEKYLR
jgi:CTP:molybdopterin cytidylyltransferase MocA